MKIIGPKPYDPDRAGFQHCDWCDVSEYDGLETRDWELLPMFRVTDEGSEFTVCEQCTKNPPCPAADCDFRQDSNGLIAWCKIGHIYNLEKDDARYSER